MNYFTVNSTMSEVFSREEFRPFAKYLMYSPAPFGGSEEGGFENSPISGVKEIGWSPEGIVSGLNFLLDVLQDDRFCQYFIYNEDACKEDAQKADVNLIHILPKNVKKDHKPVPYILLSAGGGYNAVCTMVESLPTARHFSEAGFQVFLLTYRVGKPGIAPKALDDLASSIKYIRDHKDELHVDPACYAVGGFSAGANLISNFGTGNIGWKHYGLTKPLCLFPVYTFIDLKRESERDEKVGLLPFMFGEDFMSYLPDYNVADHVDEDYPPCYIVVGKDDNTVPPVNSELLKELLEKIGTPVVLDEGNRAPHGFGDGTGTDVEGWPERAIAFIEDLL